MPKQEVFFEQQIGEQRIEVVKTYDSAYAKEAMSNMNEAAQDHLWSALHLDESYAQSDLPARNSRDAIDFLWEEVEGQAREDWNNISFFVVNAEIGATSKSLYVSPDWPSAEAFAKEKLASIR